MVQEVMAVSQDIRVALLRTAGGRFFRYRTGEAWKWRALLLEAVTYSPEVKDAVIHMAGPQYIEELYTLAEDGAATEKRHL